MWPPVQAAIMVLTILGAAEKSSLIIGAVLIFSTSLYFGYVLADPEAAVKALVISQAVASGVFLAVYITVARIMFSVPDYFALIVDPYLMGLAILAFILGIIGSLMGAILGEHFRKFEPVIKL